METKKLSKRKKAFIRSLHQKKMRYKRNSFLIEGLKTTQAALGADHKISTIYFSGKAKTEHLDRILKQAKEKRISVQKITDSDINEVSTLVNPDGMLAIGKIEHRNQSALIRTAGPNLFLYRINDPGNLGTIMRTAAWFDLQNIMLSKGSVDPYNPKVVRASMGGLFHLDIVRNVDFEKMSKIVKSNNLKIISADMSGKNITGKQELPANFVLCMGSESHGLPDDIIEQSDLILSIPKLGTGESLNLAVSTGIIMKDLVLSSRV
ncbi:MAG: RNA methyltransferase [Candidatus Marinimicrobia bacterium]|nr:RNA methyltransferase [Candidatus Neomarinimicrobiota bacterium]